MWSVRDMIKYFGPTYKDRILPKGIYVVRDRLQVTLFDEQGRTVRSKVVDDLMEGMELLKSWKDDHHWWGVPHDPENNFGFIYRITEKSTGRMYIGSKQYWVWNGPRGGYKCTDVTDKTWWNPQLWKENDWKNYKSSCAPLLEKIEEHPDDYFFETLSLHTNKLDLMLAEIALQKEENVLDAETEDGEFLYYNANIGRCLFRAPLSKTQMLALKDHSIEAVKQRIEQYIIKPEVCEGCGRTLLYGEEPCCKGNLDQIFPEI